MGKASPRPERVVRKAVVADGPAIQKLVNQFAGKRQMLSRSLAEIYENVRDYFVIDEHGTIVATAALHVFWEDLGEVRALAVAESHRGRGLGKALVDSCCNEAKAIGVSRVFALTFEVEFFAKLGFQPVQKAELPHKIWTDCMRCPLFPDCDEEALVLDVKS